MIYCIGFFHTHPLGSCVVFGAYGPPRRLGLAAKSRPRSGRGLFVVCQSNPGGAPVLDTTGSSSAKERSQSLRSICGLQVPLKIHTVGDRLSLRLFGLVSVISDSMSFQYIISQLVASVCL